jgi:hypothetical protein
MFESTNGERSTKGLFYVVLLFGFLGPEIPTNLKWKLPPNKISTGDQGRVNHLLKDDGVSPRSKEKRIINASVFNIELCSSNTWQSILQD